MPYAKMQNRRNNYLYPTIALQGEYTNPVPVKFNSTIAMDKYIQNLLLSDNPQEKTLGYLSVVFWGFYSGQDGIIRQERAFGRVALARDGKNRMVGGKNQRIRGVVDLGVECVAECINDAIIQIENNNLSQALHSLNSLPQLQIAFSSKVCAFIDPAKCGVIDSVIAKNHPELGFTTDTQGIILNRAKNRQLYSKYCEHLQKKAELANNIKPLYMWQDRDGKEYAWRALDIERSMYQSYA